MCGDPVQDIRELKDNAEAVLLRGDNQRAAELLDKALAALESAEFDEKNSLRAQIAITRADLYWEAHDLSAAAKLYEQAVALLEVEFGDKSDVVGICLRNLCEISSEQGDDVRAKYYGRRWREIIGPVSD